MIRVRKALREIEILLGYPEVTANIYGKSRNHPKTDTQNDSTDLWLLLGHPVGRCINAFVLKNSQLREEKSAKGASHR